MISPDTPPGPRLRAVAPGFLAVWFTMLALLAGVLTSLYAVRHDGEVTLARAEERQVLDTARHEIDTELHAITSDLLYLSAQSSLQEWLEDGSPARRERLIEDYLAFARYKPFYDQVRFLDEHGREVVRVNHGADGPVLVPDGALQEKAHRYYFRDAFRLGRGEVYVSPFDLNIEQHVIEQPIKPMVRFATPVFDRKGHKRGIVILNYLGERLLAHIRALSARTKGEMALLNGSGYWLLGPRHDLEWGFMYPDRTGVRFDGKYPRAWKRMMAGPAAGQFLEDGTLFTYLRVTPVPLREGIGETWVVLARVPAEKLAALTADLAHSLKFTFVTLALLSALAAAGLSWRKARLRAAEAAVRTSEARFRGLFDSAPDAVVISDEQGRIRMVNEQSERLFGYERGELIGQPVELLVPEPLREIHARHRAEYMSAPYHRSMGTEMDLHARCRDGSVLPVAISLSTVRTDRGLWVISAVRDVTSQRQAESEIQDLNRSLARQNDGLRALNEELESFSYSVSHDLRAPLRAVDGFSRILLQEHAARLDEQGKDYLGRVRRAAQTMGELIDDLLKLSRVTRAELKREPVNLSALAEEVCAGLQAEEPERAVQVEIARDLKALGDTLLLRVVLDNLLGNAWKFTRGRSGARIEFGAETRGSNRLYYVRDNGVGFEMAYADKLFVPFQRLHDRSEFPGTGIGLATVQRVIHKHGGQVWAEASIDKGATFHFSLGEKEAA